MDMTDGTTLDKRFDANMKNAKAAGLHIGSYMDGKRVREFGLPIGTLIVSVLREGTEIIPDGNTILRGGDELEILSPTDAPVKLTADQLFDENGNEIETANHAMMRLSITSDIVVPQNSIIRMKK